MLLSIRRALRNACPSPLWKSVFVLFGLYMTAFGGYFLLGAGIEPAAQSHAAGSAARALLSPLSEGNAPLFLHAGESMAAFFPMGLLLPVLFQKISLRRVLKIVLLTAVGLELARRFWFHGAINAGAILFALAGGAAGALLCRHLSRKYQEESAFLMSVISVFCLFTGLLLFGTLFAMM